MTIWDTFTGRASSKAPAVSAPAPPSDSRDSYQPQQFDPSSVQDVSSFLGNDVGFDPSTLHPLAGFNQETLDYLQLEDTVLSDLPGSRSALPSRGWSDDLCYGTGVTYLSALTIGGAWGLAEGLQRSPPNASPKLRLNSVLNAVTRRGPFLGNSAGVIAMVYNGINSTLGYYRGKHDAANSLAAGALSGMLFKSTKGIRPMVTSGAMVMTAAGAWTPTMASKEFSLCSPSSQEVVYQCTSAHGSVAIPSCKLDNSDAPKLSHIKYLKYKMRRQYAAPRHKHQLQHSLEDQQDELSSIYQREHRDVRIRQPYKDGVAQRSIPNNFTSAHPITYIPPALVHQRFQQREPHKSIYHERLPATSRLAFDGAQHAIAHPTSHPYDRPVGYRYPPLPNQEYSTSYLNTATDNPQPHAVWTTHPPLQYSSRRRMNGNSQRPQAEGHSFSKSHQRHDGYLGPSKKRLIPHYLHNQNINLEDEPLDEWHEYVDAHGRSEHNGFHGDSDMQTAAKMSKRPKLMQASAGFTKDTSLFVDADRCSTHSYTQHNVAMSPQVADSPASHRQLGTNHLRSPPTLAGQHTVQHLQKPLLTATSPNGMNSKTRVPNPNKLFTRTASRKAQSPNPDFFPESSSPDRASVSSHVDDDVSNSNPGLRYKEDDIELEAVLQKASQTAYQQPNSQVSNSETSDCSIEKGRSTLQISDSLKSKVQEAGSLHEMVQLYKASIGRVQHVTAGEKQKMRDLLSAASEETTSVIEPANRSPDNLQQYNCRTKTNSHALSKAAASKPVQHLATSSQTSAQSPSKEVPHVVSRASSQAEELIPAFKGNFEQHQSSAVTSLARNAADAQAAKPTSATRENKLLQRKNNADQSTKNAKGPTGADHDPRQGINSNMGSPGTFRHGVGTSARASEVAKLNPPAGKVFVNSKPFPNNGARDVTPQATIHSEDEMLWILTKYLQLSIEQVQPLFNHLLGKNAAVNSLRKRFNRLDELVQKSLTKAPTREGGKSNNAKLTEEALKKLANVPEMPHARPTTSGKTINWETMQMLLKDHGDAVEADLSANIEPIDCNLHTSTSKEPPKESPITEEDRIHFVYQVKFKVWTTQDGQAETEADAVNVGGPCESKEAANAVIGRTINRDRPPFYLCQIRESSMKRNEDDLVEYTASTTDQVHLKIWIEPCLRTFHDGILPTSTKDWLRRTVFDAVVRYTTYNMKSVPTSAGTNADEFDFDFDCELDTFFDDSNEQRRDKSTARTSMETIEGIFTTVDAANRRAAEHYWALRGKLIAKKPRLDDLLAMKTHMTVTLQQLEDEGKAFYEKIELPDQDVEVMVMERKLMGPRNI